MIWTARVLFALLFFTWILECSVACPTCSAAIQDGDQAESLAAGFQYSILLMMGLPFVILGSLGGFFYLQVLQAQGITGDPTQENLK